jgi:hypothetical protein
MMDVAVIPAVYLKRLKLTAAALAHEEGAADLAIHRPHLQPSLP